MREYTHDEIVTMLHSITPGSWSAFNYALFEDDSLPPEDAVAWWIDGPAFVEYDVYTLFNEVDAHFIAAAPDMLRSALAEIERLRAENERLGIQPRMIVQRKKRWLTLKTQFRR